ncbi:MAG TPA: glycoside hydrolase family 38 C-terminal domain-containing protein [Acidimicrobiales bacterium]|nr:glycoside hydrolase family 38 C-terminal domain-containing protein [Acidimicrobiales bacterium]
MTTARAAGPTLEDAKAFVREVVGPAVYPDRVPLEVTARHLPGEPLSPKEAVAGPFEPFAVGERWGGMWSTTWFRFRSAVPPGWEGREMAALIHLGGARVVGFSAEGLIWTPDLRPVQGLHHEHREYPLRSIGGAGADLRPGQQVDFYVEAAANPIPRWHVKDWPRLEPDYAGTPLYALEQADLATVDRVVEALLLDLDVVIQIAEWMEAPREHALAVLDEAMTCVSNGGEGAAAGAREILRPLLDRKGPEPARGGRHTATAVGHAHIDTAWLWPVRETRRKCARSFANQLRLLERYPEHHFVCSQAVQYQWVKEDHPGLYEQIRARVADGRWEPVGGMWVEADCNIPSGESLVRQFVHGKRFFLQEFGVETHEMWIPDVFGYPPALPQIARQAGVTALITQKMSWNDTNPFPHSTFWWEGHDGSRVLAHFPPAATYNGNVTVAELLNDARGFKDGDRSARTLYPFGYGDGGGGPSAHQLESARRLADVDGLPRLAMGGVDSFLASVRDEAADGLATWVGELYLETHRATSTTHADVKLGNRRGEEALRAAEMWSVAAVLDGPGTDRTNRTLDPLWKLLLLNQFHDIIPGSSIAWVYRDAAVDHAAVLAGARQVTEEAQRRIAVEEGPHLTAFNPSTHDRDEVVELPDGSLTRLAVPGCGWAPVPRSDPRSDGARARPRPVEAGYGYLDNGILRVTYDPSGRLTSVWDHEHQREVLAAGRPGNLFQIHEDHPRDFDAWNVDRDYLDRVTDLDGPVEHPPELLQTGPLRAAVRLRRRFGDSLITQVMRLDSGSRRIEFHTEVDWQERHRFLKVAFPVAVRSSVAHFEMQHGHVGRPTHANTSWDEARFEVCGHRWADLSEPDYGVALLNDCKYGYDVRGDTLRLSLLRGPGYPDPDADRGVHRFAYALLPHPGDLREGRVVEEAEAFNLPVDIRPGRVDRPGRIVTVDRAGVSVEAVKPADDGRGTVVRICEVHGSRRPVTVTLGRPFDAVERADLLERAVSSLDHEGLGVRLHLRPFELVTLRFLHGRPVG